MVHLDATLAQHEEAGDKGLKGGALGFISSVVVGVASTAPAYSLAATLGLRGHRHRRPAGADHHHPGLRPDAAHLLRLQGDEQRRPRLRHDLHLGDPGLRAQDGVAGWLGDHRRRHPGDGQPGPDRRPVRLPALRCQWDRAQRRQRMGAAGRDPVDRGHDGHLLRRDRDLGQLPEGAARHRADHAHSALGGRPLQGGRGHGPARPPHPQLVLVQPVRRAGPRELHGRVHPDALHLLGLGHRGVGQRGDQGARQDPGPGRRDVHVHPAGHLRHRDHRHPVLRRHRDPRDRPLQPEQRRRRALRAGQLHLRHLGFRDASSPTCSS